MNKDDTINKTGTQPYLYMYRYIPVHINIIKYKILLKFAINTNESIKIQK